MLIFLSHAQSINDFCSNWYCRFLGLTFEYYFMIHQLQTNSLLRHHLHGLSHCLIDGKASHQPCICHHHYRTAQHCLLSKQYRMFCVNCFLKDGYVEFQRSHCTSKPFTGYFMATVSVILTVHFLNVFLEHSYLNRYLNSKLAHSTIIGLQ